MLVLRLQRTGRENTATYRIVLSEKTAPAKSGELEILGHYLPAQKDPVFEVKQDRVQHWISKGAVPSNTLARLLKKAGMKDMDKFIARYTKQRSKKEPPPEAAAPAAAPVAEAAPQAESPKEEAPAPEAPKEEAPAA